MSPFRSKTIGLPHGSTPDAEGPGAFAVPQLYDLTRGATLVDTLMGLSFGRLPDDGAGDVTRAASHTSEETQSRGIRALDSRVQLRGTMAAC